MQTMAERSFAREVADLRLGEGEVFRGEGILAITKALLQSGVAYVGGYQGARDAALALEIAETARLLKGYSDTARRGQRNFATIIDRLVRPALGNGGLAGAAEAVKAARARPRR